METCSPGRKRLVLATLCSGLFMAMLDNLVVTTALPDIGRDLRAGTAGLQWVVEAYGLAYAALLLGGGVLGDRLGRRPVHAAGLALFAGGSALCALAGSPPALIAGRAVQGVGAALITPGSLAILRHVFTGERERARAIGVWSGVSGSGLALGPVVGGPLVDHFGWPAVFWINVPVGAAGLLLAARVLPRIPRAGARPDPAGQITVATGLGALVYALVEGPVRGWGEARVLGAGAVAVLALLAFVLVELRVPAPMLDLRLLTDRVAGTAAWAAFVTAFGFFGLVVYLALHLQYVLGLSPTEAGRALLPATLTTAVASVAAGRAAARFGPRPPLTAGLALLAAGLAAFSAYGSGARYAEFAWVLVVLGAGLGLTLTPVSIAVTTAVPARRAGMAAATLAMVREVGGVAGVAVMGAVLTARLAAALRERLPAAGGTDAGELARAVAAGGGHGLGRTAELPARTAHAVNTAHVTGLHTACLTAAALLAAAAAAVHLLMRRPPRPAAAEEAGALVRRS
ncbi:MFS transporter [Streptomyces caatingaensis]|uniref:Drug resistance protein n=1 Tax=Streptomyces caatingaensis TaxID=1678637 RepID=A0A0K9XKN0_9ACTN|nr:MFS transporter [Streptomyces caatingaensis]KNB53939.1 drug resistance protein [Streptomyces caatingaensis]